jgi:hypothetical protein
MKQLSELANRFKEPSSWAGLATISGMLGINMPTPFWQGVGLVGAGVCSLIAFFVPEKSA